jgi:hypothetical protein
MAEEAGSLEKLLGLIHETCTGAMVDELLRKAKEKDKTILVTAKSKEDKIKSNLRIAIERNAIDRQEVYRLLCGAEENGRQHIFYYLPKDDAVREKYNASEAIAEKLFGTNEYRQQLQFPHFHLEPVGVQWSDFRVEQTKAQGIFHWTAKLYSGIYRRLFLREEAQGDLIARIYEEKLSREVYVVRWHSFGLLEIRVPVDSATDVLTFLTQVWEVIGDAVTQEDFVPWEMHDVCMYLIKNAENDKRYTLGNARMMDEETGSAEFKPPHGEADLDSSPARAAAVRMYNECRELGVHWLETGEDGPRKKLKTIIGKLKPHEVLIIGKATAQGVDYVTYRLLEAGKAAGA